MANSPIVSSLPTFIDEQRLPLIRKTLVGAKTTKLVTLQTDVKSKTALNILTTSVSFGNGAACGWNEAGTATLSQRYIDPAFFKINMGYCDKALLKKWASYQVQVAADEKSLPFEEYFVNDVIDHVNVELERILWQGDSANAGGNIECDGYLKQLEAQGSGAVAVAFSAGTSSYNKVKAVYNAIPAAVVAKEDTVIFVSEADYRSFIQDLVAANMYHFNPDYKEGEYVLPGTAVRVIATSGLNGSRSASNKSDAMVAARLSNLFYGCASEDDKSAFDLWYSKDNREFRLAIEFSAGTGIAFPDQVVIGTEA